MCVKAPILFLTLSLTFGSFLLSKPFSFLSEGFPCYVCLCFQFSCVILCCSLRRRGTCDLNNTQGQQVCVRVCLQMVTHCPRWSPLLTTQQEVAVSTFTLSILLCISHFVVLSGCFLPSGTFTLWDTWFKDLFAQSAKSAKIQMWSNSPCLAVSLSLEQERAFTLEERNKVGGDGDRKGPFTRKVCEWHLFFCSFWADPLDSCLRFVRTDGP